MHVPQHLDSPGSRHLHPTRSLRDEASGLAGCEYAVEDNTAASGYVFNSRRDKEARGETHLLYRAANDIPYYRNLLLLPETPSSSNCLFLNGRVPQGLQDVDPGRSSDVESDNVERMVSDANPS